MIDECAKEMLDLIINESSIKEFSLPVDENKWHYDNEHKCYRKKIMKDQINFKQDKGDKINDC